MAIKPIDMQVLLPKLHKNDLLKPHVVHKNENEQQLMQKASQQDSQEKLTRVNEFDQKESPQVREDGKRGGMQGHPDRKKEVKKDSDSDEPDEKSAAKPGRHHIDIKV